MGTGLPRLPTLWESIMHESARSLIAASLLALCTLPVAAQETVYWDVVRYASRVMTGRSSSG
jgi:hypothetical protein